MEKRTDHLTATYIDLAANVAAMFGTGAGMRLLQAKTLLPVVQRVLVRGGRGADLLQTGLNSLRRANLGRNIMARSLDSLALPRIVGVGA